MTQAPERKRHDPASASKALLFDYRQAANPVRPGLTDPIPYRSWGPELHQQGPSGIVPLDLSPELGVMGPATSPGLAAHFIRIEAGEGVRAAAAATSSLFFVLSGSGVCHHRATETQPPRTSRANNTQLKTRRKRDNNATTSHRHDTNMPPTHHQRAAPNATTTLKQHH